MKAVLGAKQRDKRAFRQRIADTFAERVEESGGLPWQDITDPMALRPFNPSNGVRFKGGNLVTLLLAQAAQASDDPRWMTMSQANKAGFWIRKGAKPTYIEYWVKDVPVVVPLGADAEQQEVATETARVPSARSKPFYVQLFNGADVEDLPALQRGSSKQSVELIEKLLAATGANVAHRENVCVNGRKVFYSHLADEINVPHRATCTSDREYCMAVLNGIAHWSGHESRLDRSLVAKATKRPHFESAEFAREELRAEIAASQLAAMIGLPIEPTGMPRAEQWAACAKSNMHEIFRIARDAEAIVDHIVGYMPELREVAEQRLASNLLPEEPLPRKVPSGISKDLPNFIPADAQVSKPATVKVTGVGRADTRWAAFEAKLRAEGGKHNVRNEAIEQALGLVERQFTGIMNGALTAGLGSEDMSEMLVRNIVGEMRVMEQRQEQWDRFCAQVKSVGASAFAPETLDLALQELSAKYRQVIADGARENWEKERTTEAILQSMFGDGERKITADYVTGLVGRSEKVKALLGPASQDDVLTPFGDDSSHLGDATLDDDDEPLLTPLGGDGDMGEIPDERFAQGGHYLMEDAEIYEP